MVVLEAKGCHSTIRQVSLTNDGGCVHVFWLCTLFNLFAGSWWPYVKTAHFGDGTGLEQQQNKASVTNIIYLRKRTSDIIFF